MPRWIVYCPKCNYEILHSDVPKDGKLDPYVGTVQKPELPPEGQELECPNCKTNAVFQRHQLVYRSLKSRRLACHSGY